MPAFEVIRIAFNFNPVDLLMQQLFPIEEVQLFTDVLRLLSHADLFEIGVFLEKGDLFEFHDLRLLFGIRLLHCIINNNTESLKSDELTPFKEE